MLITFPHPLLSDFVNKGGSSTLNESPVEGSPWSSTFPATESFPVPSYYWKKDGDVLREDKRISISKGGQLYIADVKTSDVATYTSEISNTVTGGSYSRNPISVSVRSKYLLTYYNVKCKKGSTCISMLR